MENSQDIFELGFKEGKIRIQRYFVSSQTIYRVVFSNKRTSLVVTWALTDNAARRWTSIPEGRQRKAEEIGPLIADYTKSNQS